MLASGFCFQKVSCFAKNRIYDIEAVKNDYVIIITARPDYQARESLANVLKKTGWNPKEAYFNDINARPPVFKESALQRFIFPKHGNDPAKYYAVESNPQTRAMYAKYGIKAEPYSTFIKKLKDVQEISLL